MNGLPIDAAELGVPVRVADFFPDVFEGIDVQLLLASRQLTRGEDGAE